MDINITELAKVKIKEFAEANNEEPVVRIYVERATCSDVRFGIAIDDFRPGDKVTQKGEIKVLTDSEYVPKYSNGINIDYTVKPKEGFIITSAVPLKKSRTNEHSCGGCGGNCGGCSQKNNS